MWRLVLEPGSRLLHGLFFSKFFIFQVVIGSWSFSVFPKFLEVITCAKIDIGLKKLRTRVFSALLFMIYHDNMFLELETAQDSCKGTKKLIFVPLFIERGRGADIPIAQSSISQKIILLNFSFEKKPLRA